MQYSTRLAAVTCAAAPALVVMLGVIAGSGASLGGLPATDAVTRLSGRWAGPGQVMLTRGSPEAFKCVATYLPGDGARVLQNLRCGNEDFKLDAATHLQFDGNRVFGHWEDKVHGLDGKVTGVLTATGFNIKLGGQFFAADMDVTGTDCQQSVKVTPTRGGDNIREINAALRKC